MLVKTRKRKFFENKITFRPLFRFDEKGEYVTGDEKLIVKLKSRFDHIPIVQQVEQANKEVVGKHVCKKCDKLFENTGLLLAHYREKHPKEG